MATPIGNDEVATGSLFRLKKQKQEKKKVGSTKNKTSATGQEVLVFKH